MRKMNALVVAVVVAGVLAACGTKEPDCTKPRDEKERAQCANKGSREPRGPDTLPSNPKRW